MLEVWLEGVNLAGRNRRHPETGISQGISFISSCTNHSDWSGMHVLRGKHLLSQPCLLGIYSQGPCLGPVYSHLMLFHWSTAPQRHLPSSQYWLACLHFHCCKAALSCCCPMWQNEPAAPHSATACFSQLVDPGRELHWLLLYYLPLLPFLLLPLRACHSATPPRMQLLLYFKLTVESPDITLQHSSHQITNSMVKNP